MSGDVQPRKRKDKKKKKDELSAVDEPRGTAAVFGDGDIFMHSPDEHGTGGHWCAKIIFFSLLTILIGLIGLIILENRGLSELEANSVQSQYSGVLEGWLEEGFDDDHHDEHTLDLKHHDEEGDDDDDDEEPEVEIEKIEKEASDLEPISTELPALPEADDDDDDDKDNGDDDDDDNIPDDDDDDDGDEFLDEADDDEVDDEPPPIIEAITAPPAGKPFIEVDEDDSTEEPPVDTLAEEEEYERRQEELRKEEEEASHKDGGNSAGDDLWPGEPSDPNWRQQLDRAERDLHEESWSAAAAAAAAPELASSARARWIAARSLDKMAEARRDNALLSRAITFYLELLKMNERLSDKKLLEVAVRALNRIQFRGNYLTGEPVHRLLIRRFPDNPAYRNNLTISYLMANRADLAEGILKETLKLWPDDKVALAHLGFVLKTQHNKYEEAVKLLQKALEGDTGPANEPRFYYHLGDSLLLLNRFAEAHEVHKRAAALGHFLSPAQRSLYNVDRLTAKPWWNVEDTPYAGLARALERSWKEVLKEGEAAAALYEAEKEGLRERGEWSQLDVFARGREVSGRCRSAPVTCAAVRAEPAAAACRRGQVKFSLLQPGTHVRAHTGPTNCRLRMHLALKNTHNTYLRVDKETKQWQVGKVLLFDDSFEHEVWHNGTAPRLVLIVDVWHPELTPAERRQLPAI